jgi:hypothetical protein
MALVSTVGSAAYQQPRFRIPACGIMPFVKNKSIWVMVAVIAAVVWLFLFSQSRPVTQLIHFSR